VEVIRRGEWRHEKEKGVLYRSGMHGYMYKMRYLTEKCREIEIHGEIEW
jgi:hypothetical protein